MSLKFRFNGRLAQTAATGSVNTPIPDFGGIYIADTTQRPIAPDPSTTSGWMAIYCITATVLNAATKCNIEGLTGVSLPAGTWVYGIFSEIKLTSGSIIAYNTTE